MSNTQDHAHHITPISALVKVFIILLVLMAATVASSYVDINPYVNNAINLGIAVIKASFVIAVFMGVKWSSKLTKMFAFAGFVWLTLMSITFGDYVTRPWEPSPGWYAQDPQTSNFRTTNDSALLNDYRSPESKEISKHVQVYGAGAPPISVKSERP